METAKEILKFKQNSTNHILHFPPKGSSQLDGTYLHISIVDEAMEEFSSLQNRSLVEENERLKNAIHWALGYTDFAYDPNKGKFSWRTELRERSGLTGEVLDALSYKEETKNG